MIDLLDDLGIRIGAGHQFAGTAGGKVHDGKNHQSHAKDNRDHQQDALNDKFPHKSFSPITFR